MKPNLFTIATRELSQDGFFTWLFQWADSSNAEHDQELNAVAQDLIRHLIEQQFSVENLVIEKIDALRQWNYIDIRVEVNSDFVVIIEDKTTSVEHSDQLLRYKESATKHYQDKQCELVFIYLKTGNESVATLKEVMAKGFAVVDRKSILNILNNRHITNQIFTEFRDHLAEIENHTNSYGTLQRITSSWRAAEGFFMALQEELQEGDWRYVNNAGGGFLGFWYHWCRFERGNLYIQIENTVQGTISLAIKIDKWKPETSVLHHILDGLKEIAPSYELMIRKPNRYKAGQTSTVAIVDNAFPVNSEGKFDLNKFVTTLQSLKQTLDDYCEQENDKHNRQKGVRASGTDEQGLN